MGGHCLRSRTWLKSDRRSIVTDTAFSHIYYYQYICGFIWLHKLVVLKALRTYSNSVFHCCLWWTVSKHAVEMITWSSPGTFGFSQSLCTQLSVFPLYPSHHTHTHTLERNVQKRKQGLLHCFVFPVQQFPSAFSCLILSASISLCVIFTLLLSHLAISKK